MICIPKLILAHLRRRDTATLLTKKSDWVDIYYFFFLFSFSGDYIICNQQIDRRSTKRLNSLTISHAKFYWHPEEGDVFFHYYLVYFFIHLFSQTYKTLGKLIIFVCFMGTWGLLPWSSSCCSMDILPCVHMCLMERIDTSCSTCCRILYMGSCVKLLSIDMHMPLRILIKTSNTPTKNYQK